MKFIKWNFKKLISKCDFTFYIEKSKIIVYLSKIDSAKNVPTVHK